MSTVDSVRIVVADDDIDVVSTLAAGLELDGYEVTSAFDGEQAWAAVNQHQPHCVLLDIAMPGLDGRQLAERLRARFGDDIVLIAITGVDLADERVAATLELVDHHFVKPVDPAMLRRALPRTFV